MRRNPNIHQLIIALATILLSATNASSNPDGPPPPSTAHVNEIRIHGLKAFAGQHLTTFYLWAIPLAIDFGDNPASPRRILHPPYTTTICEDGTATIPRAMIESFGFPRLTHIRILVHTQPEVFLCKELTRPGCEPLPGDTRVAEGGRLDQSQLDSIFTRDLELRDHPELIDSSAEVFRWNPLHPKLASTLANPQNKAVSQLPNVETALLLLNTRFAYRTLEDSAAAPLDC